VFSSEFTLSCRALAQALVMGPCRGLGGLEAGVSEGHPVSSPSSWERVDLDSSLTISP
jgi:hypothetical protein